MAFRFEDTITKFVPVMRILASKHCESADEADDMVASALSRAIANVDDFDTRGYIEPWLISHLEAEISARSCAKQH